MEFLLLKYAHIIATIYWLGGDLGTFFASNQVINRDLSPEARQTALKIMLACDQGPKIAMPLILALGVHMAVLMQVISLPAWGLISVWGICLWWLANVLYLYFHEGTPASQKLAQFDLYFRITVATALLLYAASQLLTEQSGTASWVAWKLIVFASLVVCGIAIRVFLRPFIPAFAEMMAKGNNEQSDSTMHNSLIRCRPFVWCIWLGIFINTALGVHLI